jgi:hypothetical protein
MKVRPTIDSKSDQSTSLKNILAKICAPGSVDSRYSEATDLLARSRKMSEDLCRMGKKRPTILKDIEKPNALSLVQIPVDRPIAFHGWKKCPNVKGERSASKLSLLRPAPIYYCQIDLFTKM